MKLSELPPETIAKIKQYRWDRIIEKHEGPEQWADDFRFRELEFLMVDGRAVLLPLDKEHHPNITFLRTVWSEDGQVLTLFLQDTTFYEDPHWSGFVAVCEKLPDEAFFLATLYHEWFIFDNPK
jgi:hypothetical protein